MEKTAYLEELKKLVAQEDVLNSARSVSELRQKFEDFLLEEERLKQVALLEAGEPIQDSKELDPIKEEFYEVYRLYQIKRKDADDLRKAVQDENLKAKRTLLSRLEKVVQEEENIGAAFSSYNEIHEAWKATGDIPREKRDEMQSEYSRLREIFFYQVKIYKELKEHDLHRNQQLKSEIIEKIKGLESLTSMKELETQLKALQNEWEEIGPVTDGEWEALKEAYWTNVKKIYEKINAHFDQRRQELVGNIEKKQAIIAETKELLTSSQDLHSVKDWEEKTKVLLSLQSNWKKIGFGTKKENEEVWHTFRGLCDEFFALKKAYFDSLRDESKEFITAKQALIEKAKSFQSNTDWKETSNKLIQLQK